MPMSYEQLTVLTLLAKRPRLWDEIIHTPDTWPYLAMDLEIARTSLLALDAIKRDGATGNYVLLPAGKALLDKHDEHGNEFGG